MNYIGDFAEDSTVYIMFNTYTSNDPSASCTITNFINTDVHIHKDDGLGQRNNAAGITVSVDFDGITGSHMVKIDTSDNTVAGFWVVGHEYFVRIEGTTIDGATINSVVGQFSIENRHNEVDVVKWLGTAAATPTVAGVPEIDITHIGGVAQSATDLKDMVDTGYDPSNHKIQSDLIYIHGSALTETAGQLAAGFKKVFDVTTPVFTSESVNQSANNNTILAHADYGNAMLVRSTTPANALDVSATGEAGLDFNNIKNAGSAHTLTNITVPTVTALTGKTGFALSATGANLILKDSTFALAIADAIWDEVLTGATHNVANSAGRRVREIGAFAIHSGTAQAGNSHSITLAATADANDGIYNRNLIVLVDNTGAGQTRTIVDYVGSTKIAVIDRDWRVSPDATTTYQITPDDTPLVVDQGVAQAGTSTTITLRSYASSVNDNYLCNIIVIIAGTGRGQARLVGSYVGSTKVITICGDNWVTTPDATSVYVMMPYGTGCSSCMGTYALSQVNAEVDSALNTAIPGSPAANSINQRIKAIDDLTQVSGSGDLAAILIDTDALTTRLPAALTEPTQGAPSATPAPMDAIAYLYMFLRNKRITSATLDTIYADDGSTAVMKTTIADDGSTLTKSEYISGA